MKETRYVKITGCRHRRLWYNDFIGEIFLVRPNFNGFYYNIPKTNTKWIAKEDCKEVHIRELPTDIDGEPLECGDEVVTVRENGVRNSVIYNYCYTYKGMHFVTDNDETVGFRLISKVKPEPKPVDPIEEAYREDEENGWSISIENAERIIKKYRRAALEHMKAKEEKV
jgi:hypothetical protein